MKSDISLCKSIELLPNIIKLKKEVFQGIYNKNIIMRGYFGLGQLSSEEKSDILDQHKSVYNGYQTMQPQVSNTQPLTVYDFAGDKDGMVVNNKGEVKKYTNMGINEQVSKKSMCECGGEMYEGECMECGYNEGEMEEGEGKLDDIYNVEDLNSDAGFDYIEGGSNNVDTFKGMHKNLYKEDEYEDDDNEDDGFLDDELDEQGGNADDMNVDSVEPGYDFKNKGPEQFGDDTYSIKADDMDLDDEKEWDAFDFTSGGPDDVYPVREYETMESSFSDEIDEVDISGSQGIYGDMDPAYDFDSEGPGKAGPYQRFSYEGKDEDLGFAKHSGDFEGGDSEDGDFGFAKHSGDFDGDDSEEEWEEIDTDLQEDFKTQKNKIMEMFNRFNRYN